MDIFRQNNLRRANLLDYLLFHMEIIWIFLQNQNDTALNRLILYIVNALILILSDVPVQLHLNNKFLAITLLRIKT